MAYVGFMWGRGHNPENAIAQAKKMQMEAQDLAKAGINPNPLIQQFGVSDKRGITAEILDLAWLSSTPQGRALYAQQPDYYSVQFPYPYSDYQRLSLTPSGRSQIASRILDTFKDMLARARVMPGN